MSVRESNELEEKDYAENEAEIKDGVGIERKSGIGYGKGRIVRDRSRRQAKRK